MLIHIINGTYGHRPILPNGEYSNYVVPVTRADLPIDVDEKEAARLVNCGIAEYVNGEAVATAYVPTEERTPSGNTHDDAGDAGSAGEPEDEPEDEPVFTTDMRVDELRAAMRERGLSAKVGMTKADMVAALNDAEDLPDLTVQDVVEE